jgi:C1A family cysteine protease
MSTEQRIIQGSCLRDKHMTVFNPKTKKMESPNWSQCDRKFGQIERTFRHKALAFGATNEHIIPEHTPISNQGSIGSCVANAWCDMLEILDGLEGSDAVEQLSRLFLYWVSRYLHGATGQDKGTYLRSAAHQLRKIGIVEEKYHKYENNHVFTGPELDLYMMASNNRINSFYRLDGDDEERRLAIELAILADHPVVFGTPVSKEFTQKYGNNDVVQRPSSWVGRHAMIVTGIRKRDEHWEYLWRNSWGSGWGNNGHCWVDQDYMLWDETEDLWVGSRMSPMV